MLARALRQRIITALVLGPLAVAAVLFLPTAYLALCLALVVGFATLECGALAGIESVRGRAVYLLLMGFCLVLLWQPPVRGWLGLVLIPVVLWWCLMAGYLLRLRVVDPVSGVDPTLILVGVVVLAGPWIAIVQLHGQSAKGRLLVLFLLILIWVVDSVAYFAGRRWGRAKLAPVLSPGKTREGVYGALLAAALCGCVLAWSMGLDMVRALSAVALCVLTALMSVIGDLFESLLKRRRGVKDSGRLLPGHGGVFDRIDSLTAAAPVFVLGLLWLEIGM